MQAMLPAAWFAQGADGLHKAQQHGFHKAQQQGLHKAQQLKMGKS